MPPLYAQDPLGAVHAAQEARALDLPMAALTVACEPWMLVLVALALYSWLEGEVRGVLKTFAPAAAAMLISVGISLAARASGAAPRPLEASGFAPILAAAFPAPPAAGVAALVVFSFLAYGRRALVVLGLAALCVAVRVRAGAHWPADLAAGGALGVLVASAVYAASLRLFPAGHLARLRRARRSRSGAVTARERRAGPDARAS